MLIKKFIVKIFTFFNYLKSKLQKRKILKYKKYLEKTKSNFYNFNQFLFVFQTYNKGLFAQKILNPFLEMKVKNILVFADGCIDSSANEFHKIMKGKYHFVIQSNDLHEIHNYRLSLSFADNLDCKYIVLLQDDDLYNKNLFEWVIDSTGLIEKFNASIVGGLSGFNLVSNFQYKKANKSITSANFKEFKNNSGKNFYQLGDFEKCEIPQFEESIKNQNYKFVAAVNRSPQLIKVKLAKELGFFPKELEPYQYDDHFNCFKSWIHGYKVILAPLAGIKPIGIGGMRLFNNVNLKARPIHFAKNWNFILETFGQLINNGFIQSLVNEANNKYKI